MKKIWRAFIKVLGYKVSNYKHLNWGEDLYLDVSRLYPLAEFKCIFDVGANEGQSCSVYLDKFPNSFIYSFEPVSNTYNRLVSGIKQKQRVFPIHSALGSISESIEINVRQQSTLNSLKQSRNVVPIGMLADKEMVTVQTLDDFTSKNNIDVIDFLKIDTEGFEVEVLRGGLTILREGRVRFILLELGLSNNDQTTFYNVVQQLLSSLGYEVAGIYHQIQSFYTDERFLMQADVLFINQKWSKSLRPDFVKRNLD